MVDVDPVYRTLLSLDVAASGGRSDTGSGHLRAVVYDALESALATAGIDLAECEAADTGDGMVVHIPPEESKTRLIRTVLPALSNTLRHHNREASRDNQIRVRVSLHAGELRRDERGFFALTGRARVLLARLLDDEQVKRVLAEAPPTAAVVCVVSESFYRDVIEPGNIGVDPDRFARITLHNKETVEPAWVTVVDHGAPAVSAEPPGKSPVTAESAGPGNFSINFTDNAAVHLNGGDMVQVKNVYGEGGGSRT